VQQLAIVHHPSGGYLQLRCKLSWSIIENPASQICRTWITECSGQEGNTTIGSTWIFGTNCTSRIASKCT